ncbi:hypothetical protein AB0O47_39285 [Streptomyces noursei]|uniref:hypothetical protein n=1 Tax=Streptomyces noursei TaxID=1971 RepID=UPI003450EF15
MVNYANQCGPQVEIPPPTSTRRRFGLFSAAEVRDTTDGKWMHGIRYRSDACTGQVYAWPRPCPPCGTMTCGPFSAAFEVSATRVTRGCTEIIELTASMTLPAAPTGIPADAVFTACSTCNTGSVDLSPGEGPRTLGAIPTTGAPRTTTFTITESVTGTSKALTIDVGSTGTITLDIDPGDENRKKVLDGMRPYVGADPIHLYSSVHCMPGAGFAAEAKAEAIGRLHDNEECAIERHLWTSLITQGADYIGDPAKPQPLPYAIGAVEAAAAARRGSTVGVLHIPAALAMALSAGGCCFLEEDGGTLHTKLGTRIAFGACYDGQLRPDGQYGAPDQVVIVATGPVIIQRGETSAYEGIDQWSNDFAAIAERPYAVITDCPLVWTVAAIC